MGASPSKLQKSGEPGSPLYTTGSIKDSVTVRCTSHKPLSQPGLLCTETPHALCGYSVRPGTCRHSLTTSATTHRQHHQPVRPGTAREQGTQPVFSLECLFYHHEDSPWLTA